MRFVLFPHSFIVGFHRPLSYWLQFTLSILYCSENNQLGFYTEELRTCACPYESPSCQGVVPCEVGDGHRCASCSVDNRTRCSSCNPGYVLSHGVCKYAVPNPTDHYLGFETDLQDLELRYLLQHRDGRIMTHAIFVSNDVRLNVWFDPSWRKRMLLTLKSNKFKSSRVHMLLGISLQICMTKNSTLEPVLSVYVNPFGGSHSESWTMPINQNGYPDWEKTKLDIPLDCFNWTLTLGNRWKSFFETVHFYLRSRIRTESSQGTKRSTSSRWKLRMPLRTLDTWRSTACSCSVTACTLTPRLSRIWSYSWTIHTLRDLRTLLCCSWWRSDIGSIDCHLLDHCH